MTPAEKRERARDYHRRYYDKRRKVHMGPLAPLCRERGPIGAVVTCKKCLAYDKARKVGETLNEWDRKRLAALILEEQRRKARERRARNVERARENARRWRAANRDLVRVNNKLWRARNPERCKELWRQFAARRRAQAQP